MLKKISIDITDYKRFEYEFEKTDKTLEEYTSIKNRFLRNISHETRIPLARILHDGSIKYKFAGLVMLKSNFLQKFC